jgi:EmrB/QacA subfamily drug resistance transporter
VTRPWKVLAVTATAGFMSLLDVTIVNIAFPALRRAFPHDSLAELSWVISGYAIVFAALLVPGGRLADRIGRKRLFLTGVTIFLVGSALCGAAVSVAMLVAARLFQAVGGALVLPSSLSLLLPEFPLERRATATALWGASGAVAAATGPSLGGVLIDWAGWRSVFFVNLVIGVPALVVAARLLRESREEHAGAFPDILGAALLALGVGSLALGLVQGSDWGWGSGRISAAFAVAALFLGAFVLRSGRHSAPIFELSLFRVRSFAVACSGTFLFSVGFFALILCNVLFLTGIWHYSLLKTGAAQTPGPIMAALTAPLAGRFSDRFGQRPVVLAGGTLFGLAALLFALRVGLQPQFVREFLPSNVLGGAGIGCLSSGYTTAAVAELPRTRYATGSAISACFRQLGAVLGVAAFVALIGTPSARSALHVFHRAWALIGLTELTAGLLGIALGRVRARHGDEPEAALEAEAALAGVPVAEV